MNHTNNQIQNLQNTTSSILNVIDLTKENPANAYCSISLSKKQRRLEAINETADTRPQKRSRIEQAQEHNLPSIPNILNQEINPLRSPALYHNNAIIPADFAPAQTSNGIQNYALPDTILT